MPTLSLKPLTKKQEEVLRLIERSQIEGKPSPTFQELADRTGRESKGSLFELVRKIYEKGYLKQTHQPGDRGRGFEVIAPIVAPRYIGVLDLFDGSLSLGEPKRIPHCKPWDGCVGLELLRDDPDRCRKAGDILILFQSSPRVDTGRCGHFNNSLERLIHWGDNPETMEFEQESLTHVTFQVVGVWRSFD